MMENILDLQLLDVDMESSVGAETGYTTCSVGSCSFAIMDGFVDG